MYMYYAVVWSSIQQKRSLHMANYVHMYERENIITNYVSLIVTTRSSGILKAKQKIGVTFNSDKLGGIAFTKISKLTMCSA